MERGPIGTQLIAHHYVDSSAIKAPWVTLSTETALQSPQFISDRDAFVMDLLRTGHVTRDRAHELAHVAVREAYMRRVPPALVLGVMLTENDELKSSARSSVGAVGLMQVHPRSWRDALKAKFGTNLKTDSTNLKYGIFILGYVAGRAVAAENVDSSWRRALLSYNGCVRGKNTPNCRSYPDVVRREVMRSAKFTCPSGDFDRCVIQPLWLAQREAAEASGTR